GISGVLWSTDKRRDVHYTMHFLDFTGGIKPYLLNEMDNHMGAVTRVQYAPSTRDYLADNQHYATKWRTSLPFPVQVVARVEVIDAISRGKLTTQYHYHHGYWDGAEREFRGFGCVDQLDSETFEDYNGAGLHQDVDFIPVTDHARFSPPMLMRTWFHLGAVGDEFGEWTEYTFANEYWAQDPPVIARPPDVQALLAGLPRRSRRDAVRVLQGSVLRTELYVQDGSADQSRPYTITEQSYGVREEEPLAPNDPPRKRLFFPYAVAQRTTQWERGDDPLTAFSFSDDYDAFGQSRVQTAAAMPRREDKRRPITGVVYGQVDLNETRILVTHTRTQYAAPDTDLYILDRVAQAYTFELSAPPTVNEIDPTNLYQTLIDYRDAAQRVHTQFQTAFANWSDALPMPAGIRLMSHTIKHYDGAAYMGRNAGVVGPYGALTRTQMLVLNAAVLQNLDLALWPSYLDGNAALPAGAPTGFANSLGYQRVADPSGGYRFYVDSQRQRFDFQQANVSQRRGVITGIQDALQNEVRIESDAYWLLPIRVIDARQLTTTASYNYRVFQPQQITDLNGHSTNFLYTAVGLLAKQYRVGRDGEGGSALRPESEFIYNFWRYEQTRQMPQPQPVYTHSRQRIWHASDNQNDDLIETREYSDGFGRIIQRRTQAEELAFGVSGDDVGLPAGACTVPSAAVGLRTQQQVAVSGWQVYDNKGQPIEQYEPFFSQGWDYQGEQEAKGGRYAALYYDPRSQLVRMVLPDGSERRIIYGIPADLTQSDIFEPTAWEIYAYDPNDLAPISTNAAGAALTVRAPNAHHFTPGSHIVNAQGSVIVQIDRIGANAVAEWYITYSRYDLRGNLIEMLDSANRPAFQQTHDLLNQALQTQTLDGGLTTTIVNAVGERADYRDAKGSAVLQEYDALIRLKRVWARNTGGTALSLRESLTYGDELPNTVTARTNNLLGQPYRHYDEAGLVQFNRYDFKGNLLDKTRWVISDAAIAQGWAARWHVPGSDSALDINTPYPTRTRYDALNRVVEIVYPPDVDNITVTLRPTYNRAGALRQVDWVEAGARTPYISEIAYNAKGQRVLIAYGNGIMTRYRYDADTFNLIRLRTERFTPPAPASDRWVGTGLALQDFTYEYDLVGNISRIVDCTRGSGVINSPEGRNRLTRTFRYDALYRLTEATGRACRNMGAPRALEDQPRCGSNPASPNPANAPTETELYTESYGYDPVGNLLALNYNAASGAWSRRFAHAGRPIGAAWETAGSNRLTTLQQGGPESTYTYDASGNLQDMGTARHLTWNYANQMIRYVDQPAGAAQSSTDARYLYGADGTRVKKWVRKNGAANTDTSTVYIDGAFEHHRWRVGNAVQQNNYLHIMDDQRRIALVRRGNARYANNAGTAVQYHLGDHLDSSS
ncbi:MAG: hypothetical protein H7175_19700, partial [Burkholderiales bacterium]|nr:hypothetical protein [Anaerolineae bacterium]